MEIDVYRFGHRSRRPDGSLASTAEAITDLLEGVRLAGEVGLDFFGFGDPLRITALGLGGTAGSDRVSGVAIGGRELSQSGVTFMDRSIEQ